MKEIDKKLEEINKLGEDWLTKHLIYMCNKNEKKIESALASMGTIAFYRKSNGEPLWSHEHEKLIGYKTLEKFLNKYDYLHFESSNIYVDKFGVKKYK